LDETPEQPVSDEYGNEAERECGQDGPCDHPESPVSPPHIAFAVVEDIDAVVAGPRARGARTATGSATSAVRRNHHRACGADRLAALARVEKLALWMLVSRLDVTAEPQVDADLAEEPVALVPVIGRRLTPPRLLLAERKCIRCDAGRG
jgi:hypothetical protein